MRHGYTPRGLQRLEGRREHRLGRRPLLQPRGDRRPVDGVPGAPRRDPHQGLPRRRRRRRELRRLRQRGRHGLVLHARPRTAHQVARDARTTSWRRGAEGAPSRVRVGGAAAGAPRCTCRRDQAARCAPDRRVGWPRERRRHPEAPARAVPRGRPRAGRGRGARGRAHGAARPSCPRTCRPRCAKRCSRPASSSCTATSAPPTTLLRAGDNVVDQHRHGQRQEPLLPAGRARRATRATRRAARSSSSPPRRSPRTRRASWARSSWTRRAQARRAGDLRRRHAAGRARPAAAHGHHPAQQPRHAARRHPAQPRALGRVPAPPALRGARRGARVPRRLRQPRRPGRSAACGASAPSTAATRSSCSPRRPSPTRRRSPRSSSALPFTAVDEDQAPRPERTVVFWNPPLVDPARGERRSALAEASYVTAESVLAGARVIAFAPTRKAAELVYGHVRRRLEDRDPGGAAARVQPYRAGYTPQQRRDIERRLFAHELDAVIATQALELGIDVGTLDVSLVTGLPGHGDEPAPALGAGRPDRARLGRAGRRPGRARPVLHARARAPPEPQRRGGDHRPAQPAHLGAAPRGGRLRAAHHAERRGVLRRAGPAGGRAPGAGRPPAAARRRPGLDQAVLARRRDQPAHGVATSSS